MDRNDQRTRTPFGTGDDTLRANVAARIADIVGVPVQPPASAPPKTLPPGPSPLDAAGAETIDVRTYLLDPPASPDDVARSERRARIVRIGSLAGCAVLAVVLLVPMPGGRAASTASPTPSTRSDDPSTRAESAAQPGAATSAPAPAPSLPRRVDTARTPPTTAKRIDRRVARTSARARTPKRASPPVVVSSNPSSVRPADGASNSAGTPAPSPKPVPKPTPKPTPKPPVRDVMPTDADAVLVPLG